MNIETFKLVAATRLGNTDQPWRAVHTPLAEINPIGSMIVEDECRFLYWLGAHYYTGAGRIVDMGPLAGGSTHCLASGVTDNHAVSRAPATIHSYDLWLFYADWQRFFPGVPLQIHDDILPCFRHNLRRFGDLVVPHKGDISTARWQDGPIEILFVDAAKNPEVMLHIVNEFFPALIPGRSLVVQQDFVSAECPWLHATQEYLSEYFEVIDSPDGGTVCFRLIKAFPKNLLAADFYSSLDVAEYRRLIGRAADRLKGWQRLCVVLSQAHYCATSGDTAAARQIMEGVARHAAYHPAVEYDLRLVQSAISAAAS